MYEDYCPAPEYDGLSLTEAVEECKHLFSILNKPYDYSTGVFSFKDSKGIPVSVDFLAVHAPPSQLRWRVFEAVLGVDPLTQALNSCFEGEPIKEREDLISECRLQLRELTKELNELKLIWRYDYRYQPNLAALASPTFVTIVLKHQSYILGKGTTINVVMQPAPWQIPGEKYHVVCSIYNETRPLILNRLSALAVQALATAEAKAFAEKAPNRSFNTSMDEKTGEVTFSFFNHSSLVVEFDCCFDPVWEAFASPGGHPYSALVDFRKDLQQAKQMFEQLEASMPVPTVHNVVGASGTHDMLPIHIYDPKTIGPKWADLAHPPKMSTFGPPHGSAFGLPHGLPTFSYTGTGDFVPPTIPMKHFTPKDVDAAIENVEKAIIQKMGVPEKVWKIDSLGSFDGNGSPLLPPGTFVPIKTLSDIEGSEVLAKPEASNALSKAAFEAQIRKEQTELMKKHLTELLTKRATAIFKLNNSISALVQQVLLGLAKEVEEYEPPNTKE